MNSDEHFRPVEGKLEESNGEFARLCKTIVPPARSPLDSPDASFSLAPEWNRAFDAALNSFLSSTRSVTNIISNRFGWDSPKRNPWLNDLDPAEQARRQTFGAEFDKLLKPYHQTPLKKERDKTQHRSGRVDWFVEIKGIWGGTYKGDAFMPLPSSECRAPVPGEDPALAVISAGARWPLRPMASHFWFRVVEDDGGEKVLPLFDECKRFLDETVALIAEARRLYAAIHEGHRFTPPPG